MRSMATPRRRSCATACSSPRPRRSASGASSTGRDFPRRPSPIACARQGSPSRDVDHVAVNQDSRANWLRKICYLVCQSAEHGLAARRTAQPAAARGRSPSSSPRSFPANPFAARLHQDRASPRASVVGLPRLALRGSGRRLGRRLRRFRQRRLGHRAGHRHQDRGPRLFSALARHLLPGAHAVSRLSALRRRVQGDGARALRRARHSWTRCARSCGCKTTGLRARSRLFPPSPRAIAYQWTAARRNSAICSRRRSRSCWDRAVRPNEPLERSAPRHRPLGAGDVRGGVLSSDRAAATALRPRPISRSPAAAP